MGLRLFVRVGCLLRRNGVGFGILAQLGFEARAFFGLLLQLARLLAELGFQILDPFSRLGCRELFLGNFARQFLASLRQRGQFFFQLAATGLRLLVRIGCLFQRHGVGFGVLAQLGFQTLAFFGLLFQLARLLAKLRFQVLDPFGRLSRGLLFLG